MYLHFGTGDEPRLTVAVESKLAPLWWQERGLSYTASGYGNRIPTRHMVRWNGKWRRVYVCCYGNSGTCYIGKPGAWLATVSD
ncbi:hypothetical protein [Brevundimonas sp.]|jgi:hypothetical protein|uniref:hypothetical protein n=1 Tax=Brevundimonas sp. TaxID=1871086 RepID=UPI00378512C9